MVRALGHLQIEVQAMGHELLMITPRDKTTILCPTYPEIRLVINARASTAAKLDAFEPDAVHIATEGPLGLAARRYYLRRAMPFTTSFHTRFAENLEMRLPLFRASLGYRYLRWFHGAAQRTMVTTDSLRPELADKGFNNLVTGVAQRANLLLTLLCSNNSGVATICSCCQPAYRLPTGN